MEDSGIGMGPEELARLFRPFTQADTWTTRRFGGTGLGLTICKRLVALLGGDIVAQRRPGEGSTFLFYMATGPLAGVALVAGAAEAAVPDQVPALPPTLAGRILLAEDGLDNQQLLCQYLRRAGAEVEVADNGEAALCRALAAAAEGRPFDLILPGHADADARWLWRHGGAAGEGLPRAHRGAHGPRHGW